MDDMDMPRRGRPAKLASAPLRQPLRALSDEELLAKYDTQEQTKFDIPPEIVPDGMHYEWKTKEVFGKPNTLGMNTYLRRGWAMVPNERHPGIWLSADVQGPIELDGMVLMEIEAQTYHELRRVDQIRAKQPVRDIYRQLSAAPAGTAPRDAHPKTQPRVTRTYEPLPVE